MLPHVPHGLIAIGITPMFCVKISPMISSADRVCCVVSFDPLSFRSNFAFSPFCRRIADFLEGATNKGGEEVSFEFMMGTSKLIRVKGHHHT